MDTPFSEVDSIPHGDADSDSGKDAANPDPQTGSTWKTAGKVAVAFVIIESGIVMYSAAFAGHPAGGSVLMAVSGLVAAVNANGPSGSAITFAMAGGMIAYNLLRFGVEEPSEDRSVRIFTENMIVFNTAILAGMLYSISKEKSTSTSKGHSLAFQADRNGVGVTKQWAF